MRKLTSTWTVEDLEKSYAAIEFPEYQREPSVWSRPAKQRLLDSMLRQFDIASLYIYDNQDGSFDCIDGRQRIGAIMSFLGKNVEDEDNGFSLKAQNEIYPDDESPFTALDGLSYENILGLKGSEDSLAEAAEQLLAMLKEYRLTIVTLSESNRPEEFNLQFTRLNLGTIINSGEKLHAMVGEMRDVCFGDEGLGQHPFLESVRIPTRRYSKEQVAAQIVAQVFSRNETGALTRTRHFDLQRLFKEHTKLAPPEREWIKRIRKTMDLLGSAFEGHAILRNKAITVSTVLLAAKLGISTQDAAKRFEVFMEEFLCRLRWQIGMGLDVSKSYRYLTDFQRHVTQASVEKPAVTAREVLLEEEFDLWTRKGELKGDAEYRKLTTRNPAEDCRGSA